MIKYSVVIPTKNRADTLQHALRNVLSSPRDDIEVIVHHSGQDTATDNVIAAIRDERLQYFSSSHTLPMRENWEHALSHATGEFTTIIGDDDAIVPGAFEIADNLVGQYGPEILTWRPVTYYWPSYFDPNLAGRAIYRYDIEIGNVRFSSKYTLRWLYKFKWHYSDMPMIYNSFISSKLINRIRTRWGRYFFMESPDVTSGAMNAFHSDDFVWSNFPLSITGLSKHSTGHRIVMQEDPEVRAQAISDFMPTLSDASSTSSVTNFDFAVAADLLAMREKFCPEAGGAVVEMRDVAEYVARQLHNYPGQINASCDALKSFCSRHQIDFDEISSKFLLEKIKVPIVINEISSKKECVINLNLAEQGDADIFSAAQSIAALLGAPRQSGIAYVGLESPDLPVSESSFEMRFSHTGNGPQYLRKGWNRPEAFGVWSCDYEAVVALPALKFPHANGRLQLEIHGRGPMVSGDQKFCFSVGIVGSRCVLFGEFSALRLSGSEILEIELSEIAVAAPMQISFRCVELINTALMGTGYDNRPLGFGLEALVFTFLPAPISAVPVVDLDLPIA